MDYKVMQRPMFKLGGKAASQGTGITSGLDEKVNYSIGGGVIQGQNMGAREGFKDPEYTYDSLLKRAIGKIEKRDAAMDGMNNLINMQALQQASNVLGQETSNNPLDILVNFAKQGTSIALPALSARKKLELKRLDPSTDLALAKAMKPTAGGFSTKLKSQAALKGIQSDINRLRGLITEETTEEEKIAIESQINELREQKRIFLSGNPYLEAIKLYYQFDIRGQSGADPRPEDIEKYLKYTGGGNAMGGTPNRVDRQMGSPMMGEQPMAQAPQMMAPQQDVAMETQQGGGQDSGNQVYAMLRSRLPQEVPDEVVQLISYNKEAFGDFASIKNQEDVNSFNEKYGVQLVIDVATV
jgi:hypothetical protein